MSAPPPPPLPTYDHLYDACAKNGFRVKLHIATDPEGIDASVELYTPAAAIDDPFPEHPGAEPIKAPTVPRHIARNLTYFVEVWDGKISPCSGDLGPVLGGPIAVSALRRMIGVLVASARAQPRDFPHLRPMP